MFFFCKKTDFRTDCQANEVVMVQKMFSFSGLCPWPGTLRHVGRSAARLPCVVGSRGSLWLSIISPWSEDHKRRECTHVQRRQTRVSFRPNCKPENLVLLSKARQSICVTEYSTLTKQLDGDSTVEPPTSLQSPYSVLGTRYFSNFCPPRGGLTGAFEQDSEPIRKEHLNGNISTAYLHDIHNSRFLMTKHNKQQLRSTATFYV